MIQSTLYNVIFNYYSLYNVIQRDGDTCSVKGLYSEEANEELRKQIESPLHWIGLDGKLATYAHAQAIDAVFAMTIGVPDMKKLTDPEF